MYSPSVANASIRTNGFLISFIRRKLLIPMPDRNFTPRYQADSHLPPAANFGALMGWPSERILWA
jgi:hypothetical protein